MPEPTAKQISYHRDLRRKAGLTTHFLGDRAQMSREIDLLLRIVPCKREVALEAYAKAGIEIPTRASMRVALGGDDDYTPSLSLPYGVTIKDTGHVAVHPTERAFMEAADRQAGKTDREMYVRVNPLHWSTSAEEPPEHYDTYAHDQDPTRDELRQLTTSEYATYQSMVDRGYSKRVAYEDALGGVEVETVRSVL